MIRSVILINLSYLLLIYQQIFAITTKNNSEITDIGYNLLFENGSITLTNLVYPHLTIVIRYDYSSAMAIHLDRTFNRSVKFAITDDLAHFLIVSPVILVEEQREQ